MQTRAKYKICRRLGAPVFEKCQTQKFVMSEGRRGVPKKRPKTLSDFGVQMLEKQKIRFTYGVTEKQFSTYVKKASSKKGAHASDVLKEMLESRLDNIVYRLGLAHTRALARQMVAHGHFMVNGRRTTSPAYALRAGDAVTVREGSKPSAMFRDIEKKMQSYSTPAWLSFDVKTITGKVVSAPRVDDAFLNFGAVLEFYSR
jgi:small subunit ribosomal protein S4